MTYSETVKEISYQPNRYRNLSNAFFPFFLDVKKIAPKEIPDKELQIRTLLSLLNKNLFTKSLDTSLKLEFVDYIEQLQLTLDILEVKKGNKDINQIKKAAKHLAKKMQSSV
jgi:hypothetical protein